MTRTLLAGFLALTLAACGGDDDGPAQADGSPDQPDGAAGGPDGAVVGAADAALCTTSLDPIDDGTGLEVDIIISEINPGEYIEVFNSSGEDVDLGAAPFSDYMWCSPFNYAGLPPTVVVPAGGYALLEWPNSFTN